MEAGSGGQTNLTGKPPRYLYREHHPLAARVLHNTIAQTALRSPDERIRALPEIVPEWLRMNEPRKRMGGMISRLDIQYALGEEYPLAGRRMPDLDLVTTGGPVRPVTLLHQARPVLLNLGKPGRLDITPWADRVQAIHAHYAGV